MRVDRNIEIPMRDGARLIANLYRPDGNTPCPVIVSSTPYGKDVHVKECFPAVWRTVGERYPEILQASSCKHMSWEIPDPEVWAANGYAVLHVDVRGTGKSAGFLQPNSPQETLDGYDAIAWATAQDWCNGSAGMLGLGYITCTNWKIAALRPPGLKAAVFCQGTHEFYRDRARNDGILSNGFNSVWLSLHSLANQHGNPQSPLPDMYTGAINTGPEHFSPEELESHRIDYLEALRAHPLQDGWFRERIADLSKVTVPALVIANWGGLGLQLRGTVSGWTGLASTEKWLKVETGSYFFTFFTPERVVLLKRFFDHYLKGVANNWTDEPRVAVSVRSIADGTAGTLTARDWPLPDVRWHQQFFDLQARSLMGKSPSTVSSASYTPGSGDITLTTEPLSEPLTLVGPLSAKLWLACKTSDTDIFLTVRIISPDGRDVSFFSATDPCAAPTQGWLRASQRKLDPRRSAPFLPYHAHDERQPLVPGRIYEIDVSIWPTGTHIPAGCRLALVIGGTDFSWPASSGKQPATVRMVHDDPQDRPHDVFKGEVTLYSGPSYPSYIALPQIANIEA